MTVRDIMDLLLKYRIVVYTGNRNDDLELMREELRDLYEMGFIERERYVSAVSTLMRETAGINDRCLRE